MAGDPLYLDVTLPPGGHLVLPVPAELTLLVYVIDGAASFAASASPAPDRTMLLLGSGDYLEVEASLEGCRFLAMAGRPLKEPVAWAGPIVMNTQEELEQAFREYREGTFLKGR